MDSLPDFLEFLDFLDRHRIHFHWLKLQSVSAPATWRSRLETYRKDSLLAGRLFFAG